jgi:AcrR family transcriptional regulator
MTTPPLDRRSRKRERTASHLSATAFKLFESLGYESVSMEQIADEADVAKATLYNYFPVKEALIAHRFREDIAAGMAERASALTAHKTFDARMRFLLSESAAWHSARKAYLPHYLRFLTSQACYGDEAPREETSHEKASREKTSHEKTADSGTQQILTLMFQAAQESGEVGTQQTAAQLAWSFEYLLFGAVAAWLADPKTGPDLTQRFLAAFDLAMHGMATTPTTKKPRSRTTGTK